jgi:hypothetical protein
MVGFTDVFVVIGMFALRFGVPLAITGGLVYLLKRLDRRWAEEAWAGVEEQVAEQPVASVRPQRSLEMDRPFVPQPMAAQGKDVVGPQMPSMQPCWEMNECSEAARSKCPAFLHPDQPCWKARFEAEGHMPEGCSDCEQHRSQLSTPQPELAMHTMEV